MTRTLSAGLIAGALFFVTAALAAQPHTHLDRERQLAAAGQFEEAIKSARDSIADLSDQTLEHQQVLPYLFNDAARWEWRLRRLEPALTSARQAVEAATRIYGAESQQLPYLLRDLAFLEFTAGDCSNAEARYRLAYEIAARHEDSALLADVAVSLAELQQQIGDLPGVRRTTAELLGRTTSTADAKVRAHFVRLHSHLDVFAIEDARTELSHIEAIRRRDSALSQRTEDSSILARARLARIEGDFASAEALLQGRLRASPQGDTSAALRAELATLQGLRGRYASAENVYRNLLSTVAPGTEKSLPTGRLHYGLAWVYRMLGDAPLSETHFAQALTAFRSCTGGNDWRTALALIERSRLLLQMGRVSEALADAEGATATLASMMPGDWTIQKAYAIAARSFALARLGRLDDSRAAMLTAVGEIEKVRGSHAEDLAPGYIHLAEIALLENKAGDARRWASKAHAIRERSGAASLWGTGTALSVLAAANAMDGNLNEYVKDAKRFTNAVTDYLALAPGASDLAASEVRSSRELFERVLEPVDTLDADALGSALPATIALMQLSQLSESGVAVRMSAEAVRPSATKLIQQRIELSEQWHAQHSQLTQVRLSAQDGTADTAAALAAKLAQTRSQLVALDEQLLRAAPEVSDFVRPAAVEASEIQRLLDPREGLLLQFVSASGTQHVLVTRDRVLYRSSNLGKSVVRRHVSRLRRGLDLALPLQDRLPFDERAAHELYRSSIGLFADALNGIDRLTVVPDDAFQNIPWGILLTNPPGADDKPRYLAERFSVTVVPSASTFRMLRSRTQSARASEPFIGFGDPALLGRNGAEARSLDALAQATSHGVNAQAVMTLAALPQTATELREMARILGANTNNVFTGARATRLAVQRSDLSKYRVISFATHGLLAGDFRGLSEPALVLTPAPQDDTNDDGLLRASEIAQLRLDADLVILSACNTGRAEGDGGAYGLSGLARAFFAAGARAIVVSHWAVSSDATVPLLTKALQLMQEDSNLSKSAALKQAMLWMMSGGAGEEFTAPAYWAPFVILGDDRPLLTGE